MKKDGTIAAHVDSKSVLRAPVLRPGGPAGDPHPDGMILLFAGYVLFASAASGPGAPALLIRLREPVA